MADQKIGPKEAAQRALREQKAREGQQKPTRLKGKSIGKLQMMKAQKSPGRGR